MDRFITRRYVAICWADAVRLAQIDSTKPQEIRFQQNVELLHRTEWWSLWSDEQLTTAIGLPENLQPQSLPADAVSLIDQVWIGETVSPKCGWTFLAKEEQIIACERNRLVRKKESIERRDRLIVQMSNGEKQTLYRSELLSRGFYKCDIAADLND